MQQLSLPLDFPGCEPVNKTWFQLEILTLEDWVNEQFNRSLTKVLTEQQLATAWLTAYTQSIAQQRRDMAPIDEPCYQWLLGLNEILKQSR